MAKWSTGFCEVNHARLHYTRTGGNKPPLILLHGLIANGACWTPVAEAFEGEYDVIMPDARGHGRSSKPDKEYRYDDHAKDVEGLISALRLSAPILVGHSMGGMTAAVVAYRMPRLLRALILADPSFLSPAMQRDVYESDVAEQHRQLLNQSLEELLTKSQKNHPHRSLAILQLLTRARHQTSMSAFQVLTPPYPDYEQLVSTIAVPVLLVMGETGVVSPLVAEQLRCLNPTLCIENIPGVGHGLHYDRPEQFVTIVKSFLSSVCIHDKESVI